MFNRIRRSYFRIPSYGQVMTSKGVRSCGWYKTDAQETYFSVMLKGRGRGLFGSGRFYLVLTERGLEEAIERGEKNLRYTAGAVEYGAYNGIQKITTEPFKNLPAHVFDCVILHVYRYMHGGKIKDHMIILSERQFRRAIARAKNHPELVVAKRFKDVFVKILYKLFRLGKK